MFDVGRIRGEGVIDADHGHREGGDPLTVEEEPIVKVIEVPSLLHNAADEGPCLGAFVAPGVLDGSVDQHPGEQEQRECEEAEGQGQGRSYGGGD